MKYIKSEIVINMVKNTLKSFFNANIIDTSFMYQEILLCLSDLGLKINPTKNEIIDIHNYKAKLPDDFYKLDEIVYCGKRTVITRDEYKGFVITEKFITQLPLCTSSCEVCHDDCGNSYQLFREFDNYITRYSTLLPLKIAKSSQNRCHQTCLGESDGSLVVISGNYIETEYKDGSLVIQYTSLMEEEGEIIIPEHPKIVDFVKTHLIWKVYELLMYNVDANIQGQLQYAAQQANVSRQKAIMLARTPEVQDLYDSLNIKRKRFNLHNEAMKNLHYGNNYYSRYPV